MAATGCDTLSKTIRSKLVSARDSAIKNADKILDSIIAAYQSSRNNKLRDAQNSCKDSSAKRKCINTVCNNNMPHKCDEKYEYETGLATQLCAFYDIVCDRLK